MSSEPTGRDIGNFLELGLSSHFSENPPHCSWSGGIFRAAWESQNPAVQELLVLLGVDYPALHWYKGYMCDFLWGEAMGVEVDALEGLLETVCSFLDDFFAERVVCASGGPIATPGADVFYNMCRSHEALPLATFIRSWHGTFDKGE